ncbi:MAG: pyridoxal phosphate-dependent aminotransferase family protein [Planctomycetota bacterium]|jgi:6-carboxyhexanoate--CoA ligase|nr:pyridoxal phosphate-dependent aminotransferase family protein [Planctomycetota bacterium]
MPPFDRWEPLRAALAEKAAQNLSREIIAVDSPPAPRVRVRGREMAMLASNNYLDLANDERVKAAAIAATQKYGAGSGGARLTTGALVLHDELEAALARFKHAEAALLFNTGYQANAGIISALCSRDWTIFSDELNHASIIDGCRLSRAKIVVYRHNDMNDLRAKVRAERGVGGAGGGLLVSDGVFSMDGDLVNLPEWLAIAREFDLFSLIDEAHATGVIGASGRGVGEYFAALPENRGRDLRPDIIVGTCSKALGSSGGFAAGRRLLIDFLRHQARSFIFSTMLPPGAVAAANEALRIIVAEPERLAKLRRNLQIFYDHLSVNFGDGAPPPPSIATLNAGGVSAIVPLIVGDEAAAMTLAQELFTAGYFVSAIRYPTVARGQARLRFALSAGHQAADLTPPFGTIKN